MKTNEEGDIILHVWDWQTVTQCPNCKGIIDANHRIGSRRRSIHDVDFYTDEEEYERRKMIRDMREYNACPHRCGAHINLILHLTSEIPA